MDISDLSKIEFKITAKEDILDKADNSVIYKKGDVVGNYNLSKDGKLEINNLPIGTYNLEETKTIDGLVINKEPIEIAFKKQDGTTKIYKKEINIKNKTTFVQIYKIDKDSKRTTKRCKICII